VDIKQLNVHWLRSNIGVVSQMPVLFGLTICKYRGCLTLSGKNGEPFLMNYEMISAENIALGRDVKEGDIEEAARSANIHDFIVSLPEVGLL
jgi:ABC-type multidrug transport system fused ATPase/permease subunit